MILRLGRRDRVFESLQSHHHHLIIKLPHNLIAEQWGRVRVKILKWRKLIESELRHVFMNNFISLIYWNLRDAISFWLWGFFLSCLELHNMFHFTIRHWLEYYYFLHSKCMWKWGDDLLPMLLVMECVWNVVLGLLIKNAQNVTILKNDSSAYLKTKKLH